MEQNWQMVQSVLGVIGAIVVGSATISAVSIWLFKTFATKWLDSRFSKELEGFKHKHQTELQRLRFEIDALLDRTIKLHGREFETLPQAWSLLDDAFHSVLSTSMAFCQYPNLNAMSGQQLEEFLEHEDLPNWKKEEIRVTHDKTRMYADALQWKQLNLADRKRHEFHSFIYKNGIFFPEKIRQAFLKINTMMISAFVERQMAMQHPNGSNDFKEALRFNSEGPKMMEELHGEIHDRLWSSVRSAEG